MAKAAAVGRAMRRGQERALYPFTLACHVGTLSVKSSKGKGKRTALLRDFIIPCQYHILHS